MEAGLSARGKMMSTYTPRPHLAIALSLCLLVIAVGDTRAQEEQSRPPAQSTGETREAARGQAASQPTCARDLSRYAEHDPPELGLAYLSDDGRRPPTEEA